MAGEREEKKKVAVGFSYKKYWKAQLLLLLVFFFGFGFLAYFFLGKQAYKLVGADSYSELSRNSFGGDKSLAKKLIAYFFQDENVVEKQRPSNDFSFKSDSPENSPLTNQTDSNAIPPTSSSSESIYQGSQQSASYSKLSSSLGSPLSSASSGKSKTELSNFTEGGKNMAVGTTYAEKSSFSKEAYANRKVSALDALKGAWKASLYGARLSSQDAAKSWTARAFDASPDAEVSLKYSESVKSKLDRLNPNAIPKYLKDQNIEMEALDSVKPSEVPDFTEDNGKKEKELNAEKEMKKKLVEQLAGGMFNSMYGSLGRASDNDDDSLVSSVGLDEPENSAKLGSTVTTDEFGYIRVSGEDGVIKIFDPDSGAILGCEIPDAGMCVLPGGDGCPSGLYFV